MSAKGKYRRYLAALLCAAILCPYIAMLLERGGGLSAMAAPIPVKGVCTANELNIFYHLPSRRNFYPEKNGYSH